MDSADSMLRPKILEAVRAATDFCLLVENAREADKNDFIAAMLDSLPRLYMFFSEYQLSELPENEEFYASYVDEDYYENVRRHIETLLGPDDLFLETFEEDMKYSDTPIAASISESLADIFQDLFNFVSVVKDTDGDALEGAYRTCVENFVAYWSQTLCNVMRPLNYIRYHESE
jgi:hypothetical protein